MARVRVPRMARVRVPRMTWVRVPRTAQTVGRCRRRCRRSWRRCCWCRRRRDAEAPSHVSALMSAAMVNLGVYGILRVGLDLLGGGPGWWWLLVLAAGAVSAVYGILQAVVAADLKRLLAYSTTENMGLVLVGVGAAGYFAASGAGVLAALALVAGLLHVVNHAAFKTLLFCSAGSVLRATGSRDLDTLGGLRSAMPVTTALFGLGALAASAL